VIPGPCPPAAVLARSAAEPADTVIVTIGQRHERAVKSNEYAQGYGCLAWWLPKTADHSGWMIHQADGRLSSAVPLG